MRKVALAGNPNVGKSVIFNALTGAKQKVGNWPGVTVEKKEGVCRYMDVEFQVVDLPGIYSFTASTIDEKIARDYIINEKPDVVVNVVDASNIERNLYLTLQLLEMEANVVICLNKMDLAETKGYKINVKNLSKELKLPIVPTIAIKNIGIDELKRAVYFAMKSKSKIYLKYNDKIEKIIYTIQEKIIKQNILPDYPSRFVAIKLLEGDEEIFKLTNLSREVIERWIS